MTIGTNASRGQDVAVKLRALSDIALPAGMLETGLYDFADACSPVCASEPHARLVQAAACDLAAAIYSHISTEVMPEEQTLDRFWKVLELAWSRPPEEGASGLDRVFRPMETGEEWDDAAKKWVVARSPSCNQTAVALYRAFCDEVDSGTRQEAIEALRRFFEGLDAKSAMSLRRQRRTPS